MESNNYTVYKHTSPSGKVYIGITRQVPEQRWNQGKGYKHSPHFRAAIEKYGWENITHEILATGLTKEEAEKSEVELIAKHRSTDRRFGYNADLGGSAPGHKSVETRQKISAAVSGKNHPLYGKKQNPEWIAKRTANAKGRKRPESLIAKMAEARRIPVQCLDTGEIYPSATEAGRVLGVSNSKITAVCKGKRRTTGGLHWAYKDKEAKL